MSIECKRRLGDICDILNGFAFKSEEYAQNGVRVIRIANVQKGFLEDNSPVFYPIDTDTVDLKKYALYEGDILLSLTGNVGRVARITADFLPAVLNQRVACLRVKTNDVLSDYLYCVLNSDLFEKKCIHASNGVAQKNLSTEWLKDYEIPIFSLDEQRQVAKKFELINQVLQLRKQQLQALDDLVKARFVEIIEKSELGDETTVEAVTERVKVGFVGTCEKYYTDESGIPMLRTSNITEKGIDLSALKYVTEEFHNNNKKSQIHSGDLLIARHGSNGQANVYYGPDAQCLNAVVIVPNQKIASSVFLAGLINSPAVKGQIERMLVGSTQHVVNTKSIAGLTVRIPTITVQKEYELFVSAIDKSKVAVQKALDETQKLFDSLMQEYFG